jgi:Protein of unknown function (DUF998)
MLLRNAALAGMIGPALFALIVVVLSVAQYGFMVDLGWDPIGPSDVPWPSGLALGPLGWLQVLNFILFGLALMVFAVGLHRGVAARVRGSVIGPLLLVVAGLALVLAAFKTDPSLSGGPQSWNGLIHGLAFMLLVLSLLLSFLMLWWRLRRDPLWRGYDLYTIITAVLYVVLFFLSASQWAFYLFLGVVLAWVEVMAFRLRSVAEGSRAQQSSRVE